MKKLQPPEKSHPTLSQQPPSQNWDPVQGGGGGGGGGGGVQPVDTVT